MSEKPRIDGRSVRLLIVDDEEIVLSFARDALEDAGYEIELAASASEALKRVEREYFDFILTDIRMPEIDGLELARRAREKIPSVGIIFMTGYANLNTAKDAIKEGAYDYIMKPFELNELRQAVKNAVGKKQKDTEKTLSGELNRLSDLNQLMYTVSDRRSLMRLSLGFAMMQGKASRGSIVFRSGNENEIGIITTDNLKENKFQESFQRYDRDYFDFDSKELNAPFIINSINQHPLCRKFSSQDVASFLIPPWHIESHMLANIALKRGPNLYGFLILGYPEGSETPSESEQKLLGITASQIAISLENIILLEESRDAYRRLKELQEQTIHLEKMATKGQMSAEIGHELNNFLGVVVGNLSLMQHHLDRKNYGELGKYLKVVVNNLDNIRKFTDGLVDFSGMESQFEGCDFNGLVEDVIEYLGAQRRFQDVEIEFKRSDAMIYTLADTGQIQQLLYNLLNNAADAMHERKDIQQKRIVITTTVNHDDRCYSLIINDNGQGIDKDKLEKAFKKRFTTKESGHGFGLLVCKRVVENHKGELKIDSSPGQGTTITIDFPIDTPVIEPEAVH